jgi:hypothetical protein
LRKIFDTKHLALDQQRKFLILKDQDRKILIADDLQETRQAQIKPSYQFIYLLAGFSSTSILPDTGN